MESEPGPNGIKPDYLMGCINHLSYLIRVLPLIEPFMGATSNYTTTEIGIRVLSFDFTQECWGKTGV